MVGARCGEIEERLVSGYKCHECGEHFEDPRTLVYTDTDVGYSAYRTSSETVCPECGSNDYDESDECELCGNDCFEFDLTDGVCDKCMRELECKVSLILAEHMEPREYYAIKNWLDLPEASDG